MPVEWRGAEVLREVKTIAEKKLLAAGFLVERKAKQIVVVDTGRLKTSITTEQTGLKVFVGSNVEYAPFIELGTSRKSARPFLRPALQQSMSKIKKIFGA